MENTKYVELESGKYALIHTTEKRKNLGFQGLEVDEQYIIIPLGEENKLNNDTYQEYINGIDDNYGECIIYFVPTATIPAVKEQVNQVLEDWADGNSEIREFEEGACYISYKYTANGMWLFTFDGSYENAFYEFSGEMLDNLNPTNTHELTELSWDTFYVTGSPAESAGPDFYNALVREGDPIVGLMKSEGLTFDSEE